jgi:hypothetical protein
MKPERRRKSIRSTANKVTGPDADLAERRKLLQRLKTLQTRKRIDGKKFSSSGQSELDRINKQLARKTVARTKATQATNAKKLSELEKQLKQLEDKKNVRPKKLNVKTSDVTLPRSKTGVSRLLSTAMKKAADRDELIPKGAVRKKPVSRTPKQPKRKKATVAPAMMFDANLQQTTPDVGAASQKASPKPAAKISSGGRGKSRGSMGGESISEYFEDLGQRKTKVRTPFGLITVDSTDEGMAFEEFDQKYGGKAMPKVKNRKGKRAAIRGRRAEMKGS